MFDVFRSRDKAVRIVLGGLLGLVALSMLIYLIPGSGGMPSSGTSTEVIAEVGKEKVTTKDVQQLIQERMASRQVPPEMMQYLLPQLIDQQIADRAIAYEAQRRGFTVSDAELANTLRAMPNVASMPPDQYRQYLEQMGLTVPDFENNLRKKLIVLRLQDIVLQGVVVSPQEVEQEFRRRNEKIKIEYAAFDPAKIKAEVKPTEGDLRATFAVSRNFYTIPETRTARLVVADPQVVAQMLKTSDEELQGYYTAHKEQYRTPDRVKVRHILLMTQGKPKEEVAKIKIKAEDLLKQVKGGGDFAALAKQYSEDPGSKANGGDLGWVVRGQMVKNFEATSFALKPNEISNVISTEYGFHIVQALEKQDARVQPFDEVKFLISGELKKNVLNERMQSLADQARAEMSKAPQNTDQIAAKLGLAVLRAEKVKNGDALPLIGVDKPLSDAIFGLKKGEVGPVTQAGGRLVVPILDEVTAPHPAEFAEVEGQVRDRYQSQEALKIMADRAKRAADLLASTGDMKLVAKTFNAEVKTTDFFGRQGAAEGLGSASYFESAFTKPAGTIIGAVNVGPQTVVARLADKQSADSGKMVAERESILLQLKSKKAEERSQLFQDSIMTKLVQEGKVKVHRDVINRILARYRSA